MNISTEYILQCNQSEPLADASGRIVDLMNENGILQNRLNIRAVFSYKLRYIAGFGLVRSLRYIVTCTRIWAQLVSPEDPGLI